MARCGECGSTQIKNQNIKGTFHPWKDYARVELMNDQDVLVCQNCGNHIMRPADLISLDQNIVQSLKQKIGEAISYLTNDVGLTQEELAASLGITPEYLSMVKKGKKRLSFSVFNLLRCYQQDPQFITMSTGIPVKFVKSVAEIALPKTVQIDSSQIKAILSEQFELDALAGWTAERVNRLTGVGYHWNRPVSEPTPKIAMVYNLEKFTKRVPYGKRKHF